MIDLNALHADLSKSPLVSVAEPLCELVSAVLADLKHGDMPRWDNAINSLPDRKAGEWPAQLDLDTITVGNHDTLSATQCASLETALRAFMPWRKGPYSIAGIKIDTEWRSDWKWQRLASEIQPLTGRTVLDVGCGNGYHLWRMKAAGSALTIGIDPTLLFLYQFNVLKHFIDVNNIYLLPLRSEQLTPDLNRFDTVFSMGVLYHRRDPGQHLRELHSALLSGGELVLETLVSPEEQPITMEPGQRYARMRNVWAIPTIDVLKGWLKNCGFHRIRLIAETLITTEEQRTTDWMPFESLAESLMPGDANRTIEGFPAPRRAILLAERSN